MPSNGAIVIVAHRYLDLYFQGHKISGNHTIVNIWKTVKASEKISSTSFIEIDTCHQMAPLRTLYIVTLTYIFKVIQFSQLYKYIIFGKR